MNAVILAAGIGSRLSEITMHTPKPLIKINGIVIIERQIQFLHEIGIANIFIVVGYRAELFNYLEKKYKVELIHNDSYEKYNNLYSLYLTRHLLGDTYILDGDVLLLSRFLDPSRRKSCYFAVKKKPTPGEWLLAIRNNMLEDIVIVDGSNLSQHNLRQDSYVISGVSFWSRRDIPIFQQFFNSYIDNRNNCLTYSFKHLFWDQIIYDNRYKLSIEVCVLEPKALCEIDSVFDYETAKLL